MSKWLVILPMCFFSYWSFGQDYVVKGLIKDKKTKEPLAYASVHIPNTLKGTASNEKGYFEIIMPENSDSIVISYMGYRDVSIAVNPKSSFVKAFLMPWQYQLTEVIVRPKSPEEYIRAAVKNFSNTISDKSFQTRAFFSERATMSNPKGFSYKKSHAVFTSYYENFSNTAEQAVSRLDLHKVYEDGDFRSILNDNRRIKKHMDEDDMNEDGNLDMDLPIDEGPKSVLKIVQNIISLPFFQEENFKKLNFTFGPPSFYNNEELIVINFKNRRKIDLSKYEGSIFLSVDDLAVVAVEYKENVKLPFYINPLLRTALGIKIKDINLNMSIRNQEYLDKWYPKDIVGSLSLNFIQKGTIEKLSMSHVYSVFEIDTNSPMKLKKEHIFSSEKDIQKQIFNVDNIQWQDVNVID